MVGRQKIRRGRGTARRTVSRSPVIGDTASNINKNINNNNNNNDTTTNHTPLAPPPALLEVQPQAAPKLMPKLPSSGGSSKRKFDDIAEVSWDSTDDKPLPEVSFSANASIVTVSERPSRRVRSTYTLAASIASIEKTTGTRSRRAATLEKSVTRNPLSSGFSKPNDSEKLVVKARDGRECWLCSQSNTVMLETAHNVVASNRDLFLNYRDTVGIFPPNLRHLASPHNLVTLCRNCHCVYDCQQPRWIILPTNLQYFIDHETADYESRIKAASEGLVKPRSVPTAIQYATASPTNLYMPYFFEESVMPRMDTKDVDSRFPRAYGGAPTTMILKAGLGINQPKIKGPKSSSPPFATGIPATVRHQVTALFELWDRDPPSPRKQSNPAAKACIKEEDQPPGSEDDENSQSGVKKRKSRPNASSKKRKTPPSQTVEEDHQDELADICAPTKKKARIAPADRADHSPASQATTAATKPASQDSQFSSVERRYNLRSQYRTPPTSPEFTNTALVKKASRKLNAVTTKKALTKINRAGSSSRESVLAKQTKRKIAKTKSTKKPSKRDEKKTRSKSPKGKAAAIAPLTPKSHPSPNDPMRGNAVANVVKAATKKQALGKSPLRQSVKRSAASLFADVAGTTSAEAFPLAEGTGAAKKSTGKDISSLAQRLPPAQFDENLPGEEMADFDSAASNVDSLDPQSSDSDKGCEDEHDDGYASDSGSERPDKQDWSWGPENTANDVVEACVGWFGVGTVGKIAE
ncbi:hypothetical protein EYR41_008821 [Orbilia oligospora]|uniref:Uncharacterized protein n=1 Tax=Orbilia oligospora TaxID=2813651 RepID=A0A7C8KC61_ORBOL|nr:hypothetical protein TWF751_010303 [Orbilia oligospora]TGJ67253.1 hypothetical protein EYR41_008821 [Orbilia oligospora]